MSTEDRADTREEPTDEEAHAALELIESLEDWFCQGAVTSRIGDLLDEIAHKPEFKNFAVEIDSETDSAMGLERMAAFSRYSELLDYLLDHFVKHIADGEAACASVMSDIANTVIALVEDEAKRHFTCVPFIAGALDFDHFSVLVADTQNMLGIEASAADRDGAAEE